MGAARSNDKKVFGVTFDKEAATPLLGPYNQLLKMNGGMNVLVFDAFGGLNLEKGGGHHSTSLSTPPRATTWRRGRPESCGISVAPCNGLRRARSGASGLRSCRLSRPSVLSTTSTSLLRVTRRGSGCRGSPSTAGGSTPGWASLQR